MRRKKRKIRRKRIRKRRRIRTRRRKKRRTKSIRRREVKTIGLSQETRIRKWLCRRVVEELELMEQKMKKQKMERFNDDSYSIN